MAKVEPDLQTFGKGVAIENLYKHVEYLSVKIGDRHLWKEHSLIETADYVESAFQASGYTVKRQTYSCYGKSVSNLIAEKPGTDEGTVVIGAHYDTVPGTPGADDNASGVAVMLELARLHKASLNRKHLIFVAFVNEEPPCFGSRNMGSMVYAKHLRERNAAVDVMIALEMIGYFRPEPIQQYPLPCMRLFYPKAADFIAVVGNLHSSKYVSFLKKGIKKHSAINARSLTAPEYLGGISLSDNSSFWRHGYRAVMVTDTSFFRNKNYHQETDTIDTLDFEAMAEVVKGLHYTLLKI
ncbi:MAG: M20/M25/M40 family metallo-hydrolase [Desulfobacterales bacterium]|nr:M20/M25/M40 family metallo-hydrolase [Desulfobacterales bacterium]